MTLDAQIHEFQEHAKRSLQGGQPGQALNLLEQASALQPGSATTLMLQGVALSNLRQQVRASEAFIHALALTPNDPKILYNYAVHLYGIGRTSEARDVVERALAVSPEHPASNELARLLGVNSMAPGPAVASPAPMPAMPRMGYEQESGTHTIAFLGRNAIAWKTVGWLLALCSLLALVFVVSILMRAGASSDFVSAFTSAPGFGTFKTLYWISLLGTVFYGAIDMIDRRESPAWLIPLATMPAICLGWIGLPLYLLSSKK